MGAGATYCRGDDAISVTHVNMPVNSGWMAKKGQICANWKSRYFELFHSGKLVYYTDESKYTRKGIVKLSTIIGFHVVNDKTFEVITPHRTWCFQCKFKSECDHWIESIKSIEHSNLHHDADYPNERDYFNLSSNGSVLKLMAKMGPPNGERILYSDRILITDTNYKHQETTVLMLTTDAMYHLPPNESHKYKKCDDRIQWQSITYCTVLNSKALCVDDTIYQSETKNLAVIWRILCKSKVEVRFQNKADEVTFCKICRDLNGDLALHNERVDEEEDIELLQDIKSFSCILTPKSTANSKAHSTTNREDETEEMKEIHDTDHEGDTEQHRYRKYASPSYESCEDRHRNAVDTSISDRSHQTTVGTDRTVGSRTDNSSVSTMGSRVGLRKHSEKSSHRKRRRQNRYQNISKKSLKARNFTILSVIGRGSFGKILLVTKKGENTVFAMKVLKKSQIIELEQERNIKAERQVLKNIDHPFLMKLRYAFQSVRKLYFVLDYYRGGDLNLNLQRVERFRVDEAKFIVAQIALAIGCLHSHGIVYRDLKPENILMDDVGNCCLTDFGLCKDLTDRTLTSPNCSGSNRRFKCTETFCGTAEYLAPEVIKEQPYDHNVDWWSFGVLVFELIVGVVPFFSASHADMFRKIICAPLRFPSWMKRDCQHFIESLLQRTVSHRLGYVFDVEDIKGHQWFKELDWDQILEKKVDPPYKPKVDLSDGMESVPQNVPRRYLKEDAIDSHADTPEVSGLFDGFTFDGKQRRTEDAETAEERRKKRANYPISYMLRGLSPTSTAEIIGRLDEVDDEEAENE